MVEISSGSYFENQSGLRISQANGVMTSLMRAIQHDADCSGAHCVIWTDPALRNEDTAEVYAIQAPYIKFEQGLASKQTTLCTSCPISI